MHLLQRHGDLEEGLRGILNAMGVRRTDEQGHARPELLEYMLEGTVEQLELIAGSGCLEGQLEQSVGAALEAVPGDGRPAELSSYDCVEPCCEGNLSAACG